MIDDIPSSGDSKQQPDELLDELDSIVELLDEEPEPPPTVGNETEEEYQALQREAEAAGMELDEYMLAQAEETLEELETAAPAEEEAIPLLDEVVDDPTSPLSAEEDEEEELSLQEIEELVELLVERKLKALRPEVERQVMQELRGMLPVELFN